MIRNFSILFLLFLPFQASDLSQNIEEAGISFELPNKEWHLVAKQDNENIFVYFYKRTPISDSEGRNVIPNISFIIEELTEKIDVVTFSALKRTNLPFEVDKVFTHNDKDSFLKYQNAVGYFGRYTDKAGLEHSVYLIHLINDNKGVQVICDITSELFEEYQDEFTSAIETIQIMP